MIIILIFSFIIKVFSGPRAGKRCVFPFKIDLVKHIVTAYGCVLHMVEVLNKVKILFFTHHIHLKYKHLALVLN